MDALGHLNNTRYFEYCEQARIVWLEESGYTIDRKSGIGPVVINAACTYIKQAIYPCPLLVNLYVASPGRSSFMTWYDIVGTDGTLYAVGSSKVVWINYQEGKSVPLPEDILMLLPKKE